jgi:hypothetical protein
MIREQPPFKGNSVKIGEGDFIQLMGSGQRKLLPASATPLYGQSATSAYVTDGSCRTQ